MGVRRNSVSVLGIVLVALCGCASKDEAPFITGKGDAGQFILQQALAHGGRAVSTNNLPTLSGPWRYSKDENGIVLRFPRERFSDVQTFLRTAFGNPAQEPVKTAVGQLGWYTAKDIGVAVQLGHDQTDAQVVVIRGLSSKEVYKRMPEAMSKVGK